MPSLFKKLASAAKAFDSTLTRLDSTIKREISALTQDDATGTQDETYGPPDTATIEAPKSFTTPGCRGCARRIIWDGARLSALKKSYAEDNCLYCSLLFQGLLRLIPDIETRFGQDAVVGAGPDGALKMYADPNGSLRGTERPEGVLFEFEYYIAGGRFPQRQESPSSSSEESFHRARQWISNCFKNHALCGDDKPSVLPTRILDVGEGPTADPPSIKLIEAPGRKERYIALSHCWGGMQPLTTTAASLSAHRSGIAFNCLPKTFQDAVRITRRLGIRYLWIDSLCIIQDSAEDWQMEASRMALIYRNSWLTVSATLSSSPITGCFSSNQATTVQAANGNGVDNTLAVLFPDAVKLRQALRLSLRFQRAHPDFGKYAHERDNEPFPLLSRAWAYQERLLAPHVLHFGPQELFWECMQDLDCECGTLKWSGAQHMSGYTSRETSGQLPPKISHYAALHVGAAGNPHNDTLPQQKLLSRWADMVTEFTQRNLTFATDRLPAFSGVAAEMVERIPMQYCAGLWRETLPAGLLWQLSGSIEKAPSIGESLTAPSWSWAATNAPVQYEAFRSPRWEESAIVEDVHCVPLGKDPRGQLRVAESYLVLSAEIVQGLLCFEPTSRTYEGPWMYVGDAIKKGVKSPTKSAYGFMVKVGDKNPILFSLDRKLWGRKGGWIWQVTDELYCAKIGKEGIGHYWLVLRRGKGESTYERIGICSNSKADWVSPEPKQRITIR